MQMGGGGGGGGGGPGGEGFGNFGGGGPPAQYGGNNGGNRGPAGYVLTVRQLSLRHTAHRILQKIFSPWAANRSCSFRRSSDIQTCGTQHVTYR